MNEFCAKLNRQSVYNVVTGVDAPPIRARASSTVTDCPCSCNAFAAVNPLIPAPIIRMLILRAPEGSGVDLSGRVHHQIVFRDGGIHA
jgi:hypothetical protein